MEQMTLILYICIALPLIPMIFVIHEKRPRLIIGFMILGMTICLLAGEINALLLQAFDYDISYVTTTITPITEEMLKALPILFFAVMFSDKRETLLAVSFAVGVGFAILENTTILAQDAYAATILWAILRVIGAALMHGACTAAVGQGISFVRKRRKLFLCGTFALFAAAITFHATFNVLVDSEYSIVAFIMPAVLYITVALTALFYRKKA